MVTDSNVQLAYSLGEGPPLLSSGRLDLAVSIFSDRPAVLEELAEDIAMIGLKVTARGSLDDILQDAVGTLGEVILLDTPIDDSLALAALMKVDEHASMAGSQVIVSTSLAALDTFFGCIECPNVEVLVQPNRADRLIALGRVLAALPRNRVRDLSEEDRLTLVRLTEQVTKLAARLEGLPVGADRDMAGSSAFRFESPTTEFRSADEDGSARLVRAARPALPDPRLLRRIIRQRQLRARYFDAELFADPAWDILLDLAAARAEHKRVSVTSLCIASGVPPTTALRWIAQMTEGGLLERIEDDADRRRAFIALSERAADAIARYFAELGRGAERLV